MDSEENTARIDELFLAALERPRGTRRAFVERSCDGNEVVRVGVLKLLQGHDWADEILPEPEASVPAAGELADSRKIAADQFLALGRRFGRHIGRYEIIRLLGQGGMGMVFLAEQDKPKRKVALKIIRPGVASPELLRRFEQEAQVLGRLQHPGIAQIYEAGMADTGEGTQPYFVMEYVCGRTLLDHANHAALSTHQRLQLLAKIADAIQHAHQKGIIHRDLKPGNIYVTEDAEPKILDFGVARSIDSDLNVTTLQTDVGKLIGTLQYMSPEQCAADPHDIDTRSDVYALGVVLFELLTGLLPYKFTGGAIHEATRVIREQDPMRLSTLDRTLRGDVETITGKALAKERSRRYQTASDLASDISRYLRNEPIAARPTSTWYQLRKFSRRNRTLVVGAATAFALLISGIASTSWQAVRATRQRNRALLLEEQAEAAKAASELEREAAVKSRDDAESMVRFLSDMLSAVDPKKARGREVTVRSMLDDSAQRIDNGELAGQPKMEAAVRATLGTTYASLGAYARAEEFLRAAEAIQVRELGDTDPETLHTRAMLGYVLTFRGKKMEAEPLLEQTAEVQRRVLGEDHSDTLQTQYRLASLLEFLGRLDEAEELLRGTLAIQKRVRGERDSDTINTMDAMARLLKAQGKYKESEDAYRRIVETKRLILGLEDPGTLDSMLNLGLVLVSQGRHVEAASFLRETLTARRSVLGDAHPLTVSTAAKLIHVLSAQGTAELARLEILELLTLIKRAAQKPNADVGVQAIYAWRLLSCEPPDLRDPDVALAVARKALEMDGGNHPAVLDTVAQAYMMTGNIDAAIETERKALEMIADAAGLRIALETRLASFLRASGDDEGAKSLLRGVIDRTQGHYGKQHTESVRQMVDLASLLLANGRYTLHEQFCDQIVQVRRATLPQVWNGMAASLVAFSRALVKQQEYSEADAYLQTALGIFEADVTGGDVLIIDVLNLLGESLASQGKFDEAELYYRQAMETNRRVLGDEHPDTLVSLQNLGVLLNEMGKTIEAASTLRELLEIRRRVLGDEHPRTQETRNILVSLGRD